MFTMNDFKEVLNFWFGDKDSMEEINREKSALWWSKNETVDNEIQSKYADLVIKVHSDEMSHWCQSAEGTLASIICLDQFPRNIFRDRPESFQYDSKALRFSKILIEEDKDKQLTPLERVFSYLPFEHSENPEDQIISLSLYDELRQVVPCDVKEIFDGFYDFAVRHHAIIERFGRFPHRNVILGRRSTKSELEFLKQPGSSF